MSASMDEFTAPDVEAIDYYERLGAPHGASADEIDDHTKKYVAQFKPELSDHENADERWERFNRARQTLNDEREKELYDMFSDRFGPELGAEAYQTWEARDRPKDPARVDPVRDLGMDTDSQQSTDDRHTNDRTTQTSDSQTTTDQQSKSTQRQTTQRQTTQRRTSRSTRTQRQSTPPSTDRDIDTASTHSTRSTATATQTDETDSQHSGSSVFDRLVERVRATTNVAVAETITVLSMVELILLATLVLGVTNSILPASGTTSQSVTTTVLMAVLGYPLFSMYIERFVGTDEGRLSPPGRQAIESLAAPGRTLIGPTFVGLLALFGFVAGGGGLMALVAGAALLSVHGRFRVLERIRSLPEWADMIGPVAGASALIGLGSALSQVGPDGTFAHPSAMASPLVLAVITLSYAIALLGPGGVLLAARSE